jgi:hypothetical protein
MKLQEAENKKRLVAAVIALLAFSAIGGGYFSVSLKNKNKEIWGALEPQRSPGSQPNCLLNKLKLEEIMQKKH